jgi:hypothetical protein
VFTQIFEIDAFSAKKLLTKEEKIKEKIEGQKEKKAKGRKEKIQGEKISPLVRYVHNSPRLP